MNSQLLCFKSVIHLSFIDKHEMLLRKVKRAEKSQKRSVLTERLNQL